MDIIKLFKKLGTLEGLSLLILLFIAMPLKYLAGNPLAVKITGSVHGFLFIAYLILAVLVSKKLKWGFDTIIICSIYASIPFGTFIFEKKYLNKPAKNQEA